MNTFLGPRWNERVDRLRLGVEPLDVHGVFRPDGRTPPGVEVRIEKVPLPHILPAQVDDGLGLPSLHRGGSGRFALRFGRRTTDAGPRIVVRIVDPARRYVPRRLSAPVPDLAAVLAAENSSPKPARACRPVLFPGAAARMTPGSTVVLGQAVGLTGEAVPWARVEARPAGAGAVAWRAQADRDGEFVLVVGRLPLTVAGATTGVVDVDISVFARVPPSPADPVDSPSGSRDDPLWLLPVERVGALEASDPVEAGTALPPGYTRTVSRTERLARGRPTRPAPFVVP